MKNAYIAGAIIVGVILAVVFSSVFVSTSMHSIEQRVDSLASSASDKPDYAKLESEIRSIRADFRDKELLLSLLISDRVLEEVKCYFSDVIGYAHAENREGVITSLGRLYNAVKSIRIRAEFSMESVF